MSRKRKDTSGSFESLAKVILESQLFVLQNSSPRSIYEPYCIATATASQALKKELRAPENAWLVPGPNNQKEEAEFDVYLEKHGVRFPNANLFEKGDADRDLGPYIMAWRAERGDILLTRHGLTQFGNKLPFNEVQP